MRLIIVSDLHLDATTAGLERFDEIESSLNAAVDHAIRSKRDGKETLFIFAGDLCDPDTTRSFRAIGAAVDAAMKLSSHDVESLWIAGNHDVIENARGSTVLEPLKRLSEHKPAWWEQIHVAEEPAEFTFKLGVRIVALPYVARARAYDPVAYVNSVKSLPDEFEKAGFCEVFIVIGHLTVPSAEKGSESDDFARGRDLLFPVEACRARWGDRVLMVNGHYHRRQITSDKVCIPGSLARLRHDEETNEPGYLVLGD